MFAAGAAFQDALLYSLIVPFMPAHAEQIGLGEVGIGLLLASYGLTGIMALWAVPSLVRRLGPRTAMLLGLVGLVASTLAFWLAEGIPALFIARAAQGAAAAVPWTIGPALVAERFDSTHRGTAMGVVTAASAVGLLGGPTLGGLLYSLGGYSLPFAVVLVGSGGFALLAILWFPRPTTRGLPQATGPRLGPTMRRRPVLLVAAIVAGSAALLGVLEPVVPLLLFRRFGAEAWLTGLVFALALLAYAALSPLAGWASDRIGRRRVCAIGLSSTGLTFGAVVLAPSIGWAAAAMVLVGSTIAMCITPTMPAMADLVDGEDGAKDGYVLLYAIYNWSYGLGILVGPLIGAVLLPAGPGAALLLAGATASAAGLVLLRHAR